jgi:hypothetical protein
MRGEDGASGALFSYVDMEARIPTKRPLRSMRRLTNAAAELDGGFSRLYDRIGRPSIAPEPLLPATRLEQNPISLRRNLRRRRSFGIPLE